MEGSHFRNDDLVQESRLVDDYDIEITFDGERDGMRVWKLTPTPRPEAAVVWGRVEYAMRQADALAVSVYYDEDGERARSMDWGRLPEPGRNEAANRDRDVAPARGAVGDEMVVVAPGGTGPWPPTSTP